MTDRATPAIAIDVYGRRIFGVDEVDLAWTLLLTSFAFEGPRDRLGPFAAWQAGRLGREVDPGLPNEDAARALLAALVESGEARVVPPEEVGRG